MTLHTFDTDAEIDLRLSDIRQMRAMLPGLMRLHHTSGALLIALVGEGFRSEDAAAVIDAMPTRVAA